ncbi:MAG: hypothetical protein ACRETD_06685 [Steroidobacteraceae bacterium]
MSLWSLLDSAVGTAVSEGAADVTGSLNAVLAGIDVRVKTNLGPEFSLGGLASPPPDPSQPAQPASPPGLLDALGLKYSARLVDSSGSVLTSVGTAPATNPLLVVFYVALIGAVVFFTARGVAATMR